MPKKSDFSKQVSRREFLKAAGVLGLIAAGGSGLSLFSTSCKTTPATLTVTNTQTATATQTAIQTLIQTATTTATTTATVAPTIKPDAEKILNMYVAYGGPDIISAAFQKASGIKINYVSLSSGEVITRLQAEKNNPQTDVWFGGGSDAFVQAKTDRIIIPYISPNARFVGDAFKDFDGYWTGLSLVVVGLLTNTTRLTGRSLTKPTTWAQLAVVKYKGEISASNPNISGTAYTMVSGILQMLGDAAGWQYLDKLYANISFLEQSGSAPGNKVVLGEYAIGIVPDPHSSIISNPNAPLQSVFPSDGVLAWPSPVAIVSGAKHPANAMIFVDWCLSPEGQQVLMQASPRVPTTDVKPLAGVPNLSDLNLIAYDVLGWGAKRTDVLALFNARYPQYK